MREGAYKIPLSLFEILNEQAPFYQTISLAIGAKKIS
jgi:hypothetical protein